MAQTINDLFGTNATLASGQLTITLSDMVDGNQVAYLESPNTANASQAASAVLAHLHRVTAQEVDPNGVPVADKTDAIVSVESFQPKTFEVREDESQVRTEFNFYVYTVDNTNFDPDNAVG